MAQSQKPAFGNGPLAWVVVAFLVGAFVVVALWAHTDFQREFNAAPADIKRECAGKLFGKYHHCVVREAARRANGERP